MILNLGCGNRKVEGEIGLDIQEPCDVNFDLNMLRWWGLPFEDREFEEIHAFHILEHFGKQGDFDFFFSEWNEYWRVLKLGGLFNGIVPMWNGIWAFGDPGHVRVLPSAVFTFLDRDEYQKQVGVTGMTDYRKWYKGDFQLVSFVHTSDDNMNFILRKK